MAGAPLLFVSYAHADQAARARLVPILNSLGFDCWWDQELRGGRDIDGTIEDAMKSADGVVALWSPAYVRAGGYTEKEWCYATLTLRKPAAAILIEPVRPDDLSLAMSRLLVPGPALSDLPDPEDEPSVVAHAIASAGLKLPKGLPPTRTRAPDLSGVTVSPPFDRLSAMSQVELRAEIERLQRILSGNPHAPFHCLNAALIWLFAGNPALAAELVQRALAARPDSGEIAYFAALVAIGVAPVSRGPRERIGAIWDLAERAIALGFDAAFPSVLQAALGVDYFERNGMIAPRPFAETMRRVTLESTDPCEWGRLIWVLRSAAPLFCARASLE